MPDNSTSLTVLEMLERDPKYMAVIQAIEAAAATKPWLSVKEAAAFLGRSVRQVRRYEAAGKMPQRKKFGREWFYPRSELEKTKHSSG
jgi:hypothetical protein